MDRIVRGEPATGETYGAALAFLAGIPYRNNVESL